MHDLRNRWYPIAASSDLVPRHVFDGQLLGHELAAWRADDGYVNVWENRCLHRGVRLSIGINDGSELKCQYHGWRYANRSASCTYIPAHPADAPARTVCNRTFPAAERYGLIWSALEPTGDLATVGPLEGKDVIVFRAMPINAPQALVAAKLSLEPTEIGLPCAWDMRQTDDGLVVFDIAGNSGSALLFFLQPLAADRTVIRGVGCGLAAERELDALRLMNDHLNRLRLKIEAEAELHPAPAPFEADYAQVSAELATMPDRAETESHGRRVRVAAKEPIAADVARFELVGLDCELPTAQPGAHIDVHLPNGLVRQYSLTNGPAETGSYVIGVKRDPDSRGGSRCLHDSVRQGDVLMVSDPRNNFPLRRDAVKSIFVAGGIGITPLLSMAKTLKNQALAFELHYFVRDREHAAFVDELDDLGVGVQVHDELDPAATVNALKDIYSSHASTLQTYICGPAPMLDAARECARKAGWPDETIHFEYFKNTRDIDDSSGFEIALARSGLTVSVAPGETVLETLEANGVRLASSCRQGACGTCRVAVIEGEVDHQDVYLSDLEKRENRSMMTCVSRAKSERLVLDI